MRRALIFILGIFGLLSQVHGADFPFTDVKTSDPYYTAVRDLYNWWVISNNGDNLFRPNEPMNRDFYISLTVWVGCKKCNTPSQEDIIRYQYSPFIDLPKINQYYYCVAYAKDEGIAQWYTVDSTGKATCENNSSYASTPFCPANTITRIEAVAVLLRRANLWNDTYNAGTFDKSLVIPDVSTYWYGYAKKWIDAGILTQKPDGTIWQDEKITRGEFAIMAARILRYTQCELNPNLGNTLEWAIGIESPNWDPLTTSAFDTGEDFVLVPIVASGDWEYIWSATNPTTWEMVNWTWDTLPSSYFGDGTWIVSLDIIDPDTWETVSSPTMTLQIWDGSGDAYGGDIIITDADNTVRNDNSFTLDDNIVLSNSDTGIGISNWSAVNEETWRVITGVGDTFAGSLLGTWEWTITLTTTNPDTGAITDTDTRLIFISDGNENNWDNGDADWNGNGESDLSVLIQADPLITTIGWSIDFTALVSGWSDSNSYSWDFWDGNTSTIVWDTSHTYTTPGIYSVILTVTDRLTGTTRQSRIIIRISWEIDTDGDGVFDSEDACPQVQWTRENDGCPFVLTTDYTELIGDILVGQDTSTDTDGDGIINTSDACPWIAGTLENNGCPAWTSGDSDGDSVPDNADDCVNIPGSPTNNGCPLGSATDTDGDTVPNTTDECISIPGSPSNNWCPIWTATDTDGDTIPNATDECVDTPGSPANDGCPTGDATDTDGDTVPNTTDRCDAIPGSPANGGCPEISVTDDIKKNACIREKLQDEWVIFGSVSCTSCPCNRSVDLLAVLRDCDIVFPTILSPNGENVYARWGFYTIE